MVLKKIMDYEFTDSDLIEELEALLNRIQSLNSSDENRVWIDECCDEGIQYVEEWREANRRKRDFLTTYAKRT